MEDKSGKRLKEEKKQELQQKSQEELQREETFKTWLTGLHRRRKVCDRNTEVIYLNFYKVGKVTENALTQRLSQTFELKFKTDSAQRSSNKCKKYLPKNYS